MPTINQLSSIGEVTSADQIPTYDESNGDTRKMSVLQLQDYIETNLDIADVGFLQAGTGAVERTVQSKLRDVVSVKDFGAVGDGVTDDTAAIQAALNAAAESNKRLFVPSGSYLCNSSLACDNASANFNGIIIEGEGCGLNNSGSEIVFSSTSGVRWLFSAASAASAFLDRVVIRDLALRISGSSPSGSLIRLRRVFELKMENVYLRGNNGTEYLIDGNEWVNLRFDNCYFRDAAYGIASVSVAGFSSFANVIKFSVCTFDDLTTATNFSLAGRSIEFDTCTWEPAENGSASANLTGNYNTYFRNCWFGDGNNTGTWITASGEQVSIENCEILTGATAVDLQTTFPSRIEGGRFAGATQAIRIAANNVSVRNARIFCVENNSIGIKAVSGIGQILESNRVVESGTPSGTIAYQLAAGTTGRISDVVGSTCDTFIDDGTTAAWEISTRSARLTGITTTNVGSISAGAIATITITIPGAEIGDTVDVAAPSAIESGLMWCGYVSATDIVTIRIHNTTVSPIDPASATWYARVTPTNF